MRVAQATVTSAAKKSAQNRSQETASSTGFIAVGALTRTSLLRVFPVFLDNVCEAWDVKDSPLC
jgi:hypothetical protein